jgi:hypothetical protein
VTAVPESHEVRRWRWRQEDDMFDRRDCMFGTVHRLWLLSLAVLALMAAS